MLWLITLYKITCTENGLLPVNSIQLTAKWFSSLKFHQKQLLHNSYKFSTVNIISMDSQYREKYWRVAVVCYFSVVPAYSYTFQSRIVRFHSIYLTKWIGNIQTMKTTRNVQEKSKNKRVFTVRLIEIWEYHFFWRFSVMEWNCSIWYLCEHFESRVESTVIHAVVQSFNTHSEKTNFHMILYPSAWLSNR